MRIVKKRKAKVVISLVLIFTVLLTTLFAYIFTTTLRPRIVTITQSYAKNVVSQVVDDAVKNVMLEELFAYDELVFINRDEHGRITSVSSNTTKINRFANDLGIDVGNKLDKISLIKNKLYVSSLVGIDLLSGIGPQVSVRFCPISVANADIYHTFEEAGINQTLHTVNLNVNVEMAIVLPLAYSTVKIDSTMPISQTLIVGTVPEAYFNKKQ